MKQALESDIDQLHNFIEEYNFSTLISSTNDLQTISHAPLLLDRKQGQYGTLTWHLSKENPHVDKFNGKQTAICIIHGPHAYISPEWYVSSPNVPTWNYAILHLTGIPEKVSKEQLDKDLSRMVIQHEMKVNSHYIIPDDYKSKLINHIVGFKMEIVDIKTKFKLGKNRSREDQANVTKNLQSLESCDSFAYLNLLQLLK